MNRFVFFRLKWNLCKRFRSNSSRMTLDNMTSNFLLKAAVTTSDGLPEQMTPLIQTFESMQALSMVDIYFLPLKTILSTSSGLSFILLATPSRSELSSKQWFSCSFRPLLQRRDRIRFGFVSLWLWLSEAKP